MVLRNLLLVPWMWCRLCYHAAHPDKYSLEEHFKMLRFIVQRANKGGNVIVESYGAENLPEQDGFVMYPNHQGLYDVLAIAGDARVPLRLLQKRSRACSVFKAGLCVHPRAVYGPGKSAAVNAGYQ